MGELTTELAARINAEHKAANDAANQSIQHARECGRLLTKAKALVPHGGWQKWLHANFDGSARSARVYMQLDREWDRLTQNGSTLPFSSVRDALRLMPPEQDETTGSYPVSENSSADVTTGERFIDFPADGRRELCEKWWDILAGQTVLYDAAGWEAERIAEEVVCMPVEAVRAVLNPILPTPPMFLSDRVPMALYAAEVQGSVNFQLWMAYENASWSAENRERMPELTPALKAMAGSYRRKWDAAPWMLRDSIRENGLDAFACAVDWATGRDMRAAFCIIPPTPLSREEFDWALRECEAAMALMAT